MLLGEARSRGATLFKNWHQSSKLVGGTKSGRKKTAPKGGKG